MWRQGWRTLCLPASAIFLEQINNMDKDKIEKLLEAIDGYKLTKPEKVAFNYLIDFTELGRFDGDRLFSLCEAMMEEVLGRNAGTPKPYDPHFGDNKICLCGHFYDRHFDSYDSMSPIGCKYCDKNDSRYDNGFCAGFKNQDE